MDNEYGHLKSGFVTDGRLVPDAAIVHRDLLQEAHAFRDICLSLGLGGRKITNKEWFNFYVDFSHSYREEHGEWVGRDALIAMARDMVKRAPNRKSRRIANKRAKRK